MGKAMRYTAIFLNSVSYAHLWLWCASQVQFYSSVFSSSLHVFLWPSCSVVSADHPFCFPLQKSAVPWGISCVSVVTCSNRNAVFTWMRFLSFLSFFWGRRGMRNNVMFWNEYCRPWWFSLHLIIFYSFHLVDSWQIPVFPLHFVSALFWIIPFLIKYDSREWLEISKKERHRFSYQTQTVSTESLYGHPSQLHHSDKVLPSLSLLFTGWMAPCPPTARWRTTPSSSKAPWPTTWQAPTSATPQTASARARDG